MSFDHPPGWERFDYSRPDTVFIGPASGGGDDYVAIGPAAEGSDEIASLSSFVTWLEDVGMSVRTPREVSVNGIQGYTAQIRVSPPAGRFVGQITLLHGTQDDYLISCQQQPGSGSELMYGCSLVMKSFEETRGTG